MTAKSRQSIGSKFNRPHTIIPEEDTIWAIDQKPCVLRFWQQCWLADPYGSRWMKLATNLSDSAFRFARRVLETASLFTFRRISFGSDGRTSVWEVKNLHGARVKDFWQSKKNEANTASNKADNISDEANIAINEPDTVTQNQSEQAFDVPSQTPQQHITNSSKEFVMCDSSKEEAIAPLEGASPPSVESVEQKEKDLSMPTDTHNPHEGTYSPAPVTLNQDEIFNWLDRADAGVCPPLWVIQYLLDSKYYFSMRDSLTKFGQQWNVSVVNYQVQKSSEAGSMVANNFTKSQVRPARIHKLKLAQTLGENPGFEYLKECWDDDPALRIVIKKLVAKFPEWGFTIAGEDLIDDC
ncbi:hypothetical protein VF14_03350 [Nostoc linckia z18]|jgi:hypothetical protein|uniref:Uncharacterized protein n=2 Tax=Nostoc linckia TaxID=92942 RepID=A0A9Q5ZH20_NOSLI|nr:hypothetical protein [Nostoc linckia]PHK42411.1 hypothetical protein VF12_03365 [Nostoc linckia z15]PHK46919.1 hypothetical protein VF13_07990 [Nostoc linckia z16]PHJ69181.1 hypothetical protein VF02_00820 [Nostoc linckia z1]PHJ73332.1 hypothetical protein VF05_01835 [Nostoc linckia z3]PHJ78679.1 hypothetical protein VF03_00820 [Nostoc linckia z2]